ncbi:MAG: DUF6624 domain-containing protein [Bacteroidota bacterium]
MKYILFTLILCYAFNLKGQEKVQFPLLKKRIDSLAFIDKKTGQDVRNAKNTERDSLRKIVKVTFMQNTELLKDIFAEYGFPNYDKVGKETSSNFWLCVQHSDHDLKFQEEVLREMKKQVKRKKANPSNFAFLTDRVNINQHKAQIYGTQVTYDQNKTAVPKNLENPKGVNNRRKSIGLEPIEEYLEFLTEAHRQMNPDK